MTEGPLLKLVGLRRPDAQDEAQNCGYRLGRRCAAVDPATARTGLAPDAVHVVTAGRPARVAEVYVCRPLTDAERDLAGQWSGLVAYVYNRHMAFKVLPAYEQEVLPDGFMGLLSAVVRYDPAGGRFAVFAYGWILQALRTSVHRWTVVRRRLLTTREHVKMALELCGGAYTDPAVEPWGQPSLVDLINRVLPKSFSTRDLEILNARWGYDDRPEPGHVVGARCNLTNRSVSMIEAKARLRLAGPVDRLLRR